MATVGKPLAFLPWGHQSIVPMHTQSQEVRCLVISILETPDQSAVDVGGERGTMARLAVELIITSRWGP